MYTTVLFPNYFLQDYVVIGTSVNLAARLMGKADGLILVDAVVSLQLSVAERGFLEDVTCVTVKGSPKPIKTFVVPLSAFATFAAKEMDWGQETMMHKELVCFLKKSIEQQLCTPFDRPLGPGASAIFVCGTAGSGISSTSACFDQLASEKRLKSLWVILTAGDELKLYGTVGALIRCFYSDRLNSAAQFKKVLEELLIAESPATSALLASELSHIMGFSCLKSEANLSRPDIDKALASILSQRLSARRCVLIVERAEFCDEASWRVLGILFQTSVKALALFSVTLPKTIQPMKRPMITLLKRLASFNRVAPTTKSLSHLPAESVEALVFSRGDIVFSPSTAQMHLMRSATARVFEIPGCSASDVEAMLSRSLKVPKVDPNLVASVLEVSSGNPFWCKLVGEYIQKSNLKSFTVDQGAVVDSLQFLIVFRFEMLSSEQHLILKYGSVVGEKVDLKLLTRLVPPQLRDTLDYNLRLICENGLLMCASRASSLYAFQNEIVRKSIYDLIPPSLAAQLHLELAEYIESFNASNVEPHYVSLAHHYGSAVAARAHYGAAGSSISTAFYYTWRSMQKAVTVGNFTSALAFGQTARQYLTIARDVDKLIDASTGVLQMLLQSGRPSGWQYKLGLSCWVPEDKNMKDLRENYEDLVRELKQEKKAFRPKRKKDRALSEAEFNAMTLVTVLSLS